MPAGFLAEPEEPAALVCVVEDGERGDEIGHPDAEDPGAGMEVGAEEQGVLDGAWRAGRGREVSIARGAEREGHAIVFDRQVEPRCAIAIEEDGVCARAADVFRDVGSVVRIGGCEAVGVDREHESDCGRAVGERGEVEGVEGKEAPERSGGVGERGKRAGAEVTLGMCGGGGEHRVGGAREVLAGDGAQGGDDVGAPLELVGREPREADIIDAVGEMGEWRRVGLWREDVVVAGEAAEDGERAWAVGDNGRPDGGVVVDARGGKCRVDDLVDGRLEVWRPFDACESMGEGDEEVIRIRAGGGGGRPERARCVGAACGRGRDSDADGSRDEASPGGTEGRQAREGSGLRL